MAGQPGTDEIRPAGRGGPGLTRRDLLWRGAAGAGLLAAGPVLAACSSGGTATSSASASASAGTPKRGGTLSFGRQTGPTQLDPANSIVEGDVYTLDKIFEPLYITSPAGQLVPWLAQGHTVSTDGKTWTFALRPGVKFSDGKPVTADDVVFSIKRAAGDANGPLSFLDFAISSLKADGTSSVVATLSQPWAPFLSDISVFANAIMPANFGGQSASAFFASPVGTGPFTLKSFVKGGNVSLARNPHYWQAGKPYLDAVEFVYISDDNQRVLQLKSGQVQVISAVPPTQVSALKADSSVVLEEFPSWAVDLLFFNEKVPQFADRNVRRAISYALNVPAIAQATTYGTAKAGGSFFPPSLQYYSDVPTLSYSLSAAKAELAKSKYPHGFSFQLLVSSGNSQYVAAATIIQQQLKPLGITVTLNQLDDAAFHTAFEAFNYQAMINGATNDISDPDEMASFQVDVKNGGSHSFWTYYDNPSAIALVRQAETEFDNAKRAALYGQIQAIVAQDAPYIALDYPPNIYAWSPQPARLRGEPGRCLPAGGRLAGLAGPAAPPGGAGQAARPAPARRRASRRSRRAVLGYAARRLAAAIPVVLGVAVVTFLLLRLIPGDPARVVLGLHASPQQVAQLRRQLGLDAPIYQQLWSFLVALAHGNTGTSIYYKEPVSTLIAAALPVTAWLVALSALFCVVITVPLASLAAARQDRPADHAVRVFSLVGLGMPSFFFGIILIIVFAVDLHWFSVGGWGTTPAEHLRSLVLPALTAAIAITPVLIRSLRVGMLEVIESDFVAAARAKGLRGHRVLLAPRGPQRADPDGDPAGHQPRLPDRQHGGDRAGLRPQRPGQPDAERDRRAGLPRRAGGHHRLRDRGRRHQPADRPGGRPARSQDQAPLSATAAGAGAGAPLTDDDQVPIALAVVRGPGGPHAGLSWSAPACSGSCCCWPCSRR